MRTLYVLALVLLFLPTATVASTQGVDLAPASGAASCEQATASNPLVVDSGCGICIYWVSYWDPVRGGARNICVI